MKAIILAAGYATRLYPLTENFPKPLLPVGKEAIIDHIMNKIEAVEEIDEIFIVTNQNFYAHFIHWRDNSTYHKKITVVNDFTTSNENRLGAVKDLCYVIESQEINDDVLVLAGDNLFEFELTDLVSFFKEKSENVITMHELEDEEALKRTGVVKTKEDGRVTEFVEKPAKPESNLAVPPFYLYRKETVTKHIKNYIVSVRENKEETNTNTDIDIVQDTKLDAPGNLIPYLIENSCVYAYRFYGSRYDIGSLESYNKVKKIFENF